MLANPHKKIITIFNDELAGIFRDKGARVITLYEFDNVRCYKITLRGRAQCRLIESQEFLEFLTSNVMDGYRVVKKRIQPPIYCLTKEGAAVITTDKDGNEQFPLCRDPEFLKKIVTPPGGTAEAESYLVETWLELQALISKAKDDGIEAVRVFLGHGQHSELPYQETYQTEFVAAVCAASAQPSNEDAAPLMPESGGEAGNQIPVDSASSSGDTEKESRKS